MASVSVIIPTYNRRKFLREAIESALAQSEPIEEIIVVDDGSTDGTREMIEAIQGPIRYFWQENAGPAAARNRGMAAARCDFVAFQDSDDLWTDTKTALQLEMFDRNPELDLVFGLMGNFERNPDEWSPEVKNRATYEYLRANTTNLERVFDCLLEDNFIPTPTVILRRRSVEKVGEFKEGWNWSEDYDYWLRASQNCRFGFLDQVVLLRRRHEDNLVNDFAERLTHRARLLEGFRCSIRMIDQKQQQTLDRHLADIYYDLGSFFIKRGEFRKARLSLSKCPDTRRKDWKWRAKMLVAGILGHIR